MPDNEEQRARFEQLLKIAGETYSNPIGTRLRNAQSTEQLLEIVKEAEAHWINERSHGRKAIGKKFQTFCTSAYQFLNEYSPLVDASKSIEAGVGGAISMGYPAIVVLLKVVARKDYREDLIKTSLDDISGSLKLVREYSALYEKDEGFENFVLEVSDAMFCFALNALDYYQRSSSRRLYLALRPLSKDDLPTQVSSIDQAVRRVLNQATILLHQRCNSMRKMIEGLNEQRAKERDEKTTNRHKKVTSLLIRQKTAEMDPEERLRSLRETWHTKKFHKREKATEKTLQDDESVTDWRDHRTSSLLVAEGTNHHTVGYVEGSWLSPALIELSFSMRAEGKKSIPLYTKPSDEPTVVFSDIIQGLIRGEDDFFNAEYQALRNDLATCSGERGLEPWAAMASRLLEAWTTRMSTPVYLFIDLSQQGISGKETPTIRRDLFKRLYDLTCLETTTVKVFVLIESCQSHHINVLYDLQKSEVTGHVVIRKDWFQG